MELFARSSDFSVSAGKELFVIFSRVLCFAASSYIQRNFEHLLAGANTSDGLKIR